LQAGEATGNWRNLPLSEVTRPRVAIPLYEAGVAIRVWRRAVLELTALNLRNLYKGDDESGPTLMVSVPFRY